MGLNRKQRVALGAAFEEANAQAGELAAELRLKSRRIEETRDLRKRLRVLRREFLRFVENNCDNSGMTPRRSLFENATDLRVKDWRS